MTLFTTYAKMTDKGNEVHSEVYAALMPIINKYSYKGYSIIDLQVIATNVLLEIALDKRLELQFKHDELLSSFFTTEDES